jgi:hypothetical protein
MEKYDRNTERIGYVHGSTRSYTEFVIDDMGTSNTVNTNTTVYEIEIIPTRILYLHENKHVEKCVIRWSTGRLIEWET